jgi:hypothetical protein
MARDQSQLHQILLDLAGDDANVYFQPPEGLTMQYPCIRYERDKADTQFAGNRPYRFTLRYQVMVIDKEPDNPVLQKIAELPMCTFDRFYAVDNLNHDVFNLYF